MSTYAISEDRDEMWHFIRVCSVCNLSSETGIQYIWEIVTRAPSIYKMYHPECVYVVLWKNSIRLKWVKDEDKNLH